MTQHIYPEGGCTQKPRVASRTLGCRMTSTFTPKGLALKRPGSPRAPWVDGSPTPSTSQRNCLNHDARTLASILTIHSNHLHLSRPLRGLRHATWLAATLIWSFPLSGMSGIELRQPTQGGR